MSRNKESFSFIDIVTNVAGSSIVFGGFLYAGGWSYLYQYYRSFGLEVSELDIPVYHALIYSLPVIFNSFWSAIIVFSLIILTSLLFNLKRVRSKLTASTGTALLFILILLTGYSISRYGAKLGNQKAALDMQEATSNLPTIAIEISPEQSGTGSDMTTAELDKLEFKLLAHTKAQYYIFRPFSSRDIQGANVELIIIPESRVQRIRLQRGVE